MKREIKWGILGPGKIAHRFTEGLLVTEGALLQAVGSRSAARAKDFAGRYGYVRHYGSYEELAADPDTEVVYVASPHSHHMEHTMLCLENGKSVICEKAFAINGTEVRRMVEMARAKGLFLMEALWPPFQPFYRKAFELIESGDAGRVMSVRSWFAFVPPYEPEKRLYNPLLGGGTLLDIGIYPVIDALLFLGVPDKIEAYATFAETGVDDSIDMLLGYSDGRTASLYASLKTESGVGTDLLCEKGTISLRRYSDGTQVTTLVKGDSDPQRFSYTPEARGFQYEAEEVMSALREGRKESSTVPLSFSLDLIDTMDRVRRRCGIVYHDREEGRK